MKKTKTESIALGCYHENGVVPSYMLAKLFAKKNGRVATMLDIVDARINSNHDCYEWGRYFTTLSAEYVGRGVDGKMKLIVAHGIGPLSTIDGIKKAYSYSYKDKSRNTDGGRITIEEFLKLENGDYGEVSIVDFEKYLKSTKYPFYGCLEEGKENLNPVLKARLGPNYKKYIQKAQSFFDKWSKSLGTGLSHSRKIISVESGNLSYTSNNIDRDIKPGFASAYLISVGGLCNVGISGEDGYALAHELGLHDWSNSAIFVGIDGENKISSINIDFSYDKAISNIFSLSKILVESNFKNFENKLFVLMKAGSKYFTQIPKMGTSLDTYEPEFEVRTLEKIGDILKINISTEGSYNYVKYDLSTIKMQMPISANCYEIVKHEYDKSSDHHIKVQFYKANIDFSARVLTEKEIYNNFDLMQELMHLYNN